MGESRGETPHNGGKRARGVLLTDHRNSRGLRTPESGLCLTCIKL